MAASYNPQLKGQQLDIQQTDTFEETGAEFIAAVIAAKPDALVVVPTGNTPIGVYKVLAERYRQGKLDTSQLRIAQLDAYLGIAADDRRSLYRWMWEAFCEPLGIPASNIIRLPGDAEDPAAACNAYDHAVRAAGGFDLAILGLGLNGHLGFNEPPSSADAPTRVVELSAESIASNAVYWGGRAQVPTHALTCGMDLLLAARQTLLLVAGSQKREILKRVLTEDALPALPASLLRKAANVTVLCDLAASEGLE